MVLGGAGRQNGGRWQSQSKELDGRSTDIRAAAQDEDRFQRAATGGIKIRQRNMQANADGGCGCEIADPTDLRSQFSRSSRGFLS